MEGEEDTGMEEVHHRQRESALWRVFGRRVPRSEIVFVCQIILIYAVVSVSLFNFYAGIRNRQSLGGFAQQQSRLRASQPFH